MLRVARIARHLRSQQAAPRSTADAEALIGRGKCGRLVIVQLGRIGMEQCVPGGALLRTAKLDRVQSIAANDRIGLDSPGVESATTLTWSASSP